jgi:hypothetical protein
VKAITVDELDAWIQAHLDLYSPRFYPPIGPDEAAPHRSRVAACSARAVLLALRQHIGTAEAHEATLEASEPAFLEGRRAVTPAEVRDALGLRSLADAGRFMRRLGWTRRKLQTAHGRRWHYTRAEAIEDVYRADK